LKYKYRRPILPHTHRDFLTKFLKQSEGQGPGSLSQNQERRNRIPGTTLQNPIHGRSQTSYRKSPRNRRHTRFLMKLLRLPYEASSFQGTSLSPTWSTTFLGRTTCPQELSKDLCDHRDERSRRLDSLQGLCHSPTRNTVAEKSTSLLQRYRGKIRSLSQELTKSRVFTQGYASSDKTLRLPTRLSSS